MTRGGWGREDGLVRWGGGSWRQGWFFRCFRSSGGGCCLWAWLLLISLHSRGLTDIVAVPWHIPWFSFYQRLLSLFLDVWNSGLREEAGSLIYVLRKLASEGEVIERVIRLLQSLIRDEDLSFFIPWLSWTKASVFISQCMEFWFKGGSWIPNLCSSQACERRGSNWTCYSIVTIFNSWWGSFFLYSLALFLSKTSLSLNVWNSVLEEEVGFLIYD